MEQIRALNALEGFVVLSKSATSPRAAADLITQATSSPNTFLFAELLHTANIQALRSSKEYSPHLTLLEIFSWGTIADYRGKLLILVQRDTNKTKSGDWSPKTVSSTTPKATDALTVTTRNLCSTPYVQTLIEIAITIIGGRA
jgi:hypothetical protein